MITEDWAYKFLFPKINRVFVSEHYITSGKYIVFTEEQWKDWFPDKKFIFDYVDCTVRTHNG